MPSALFGLPQRQPTLGGDVGSVVSPIVATNVLRWAPLLERYRGSIPLQYLFAWIQKESNGNPCSYTTLRESGIFQLMWPHNLSEGGTTEDQLRAACVGTTQKAARTLTDAELEEQIRSGIQYINHARAYARQYVKWPESSPDFWKMVKMVHVAPARVKQYAPGASSWAEFRQRAAAGGGTPASWLDNADWVGAHGIGGGGASTALVLVGLVAVGALFYLRSRRR
jgi:hypothetical protein